MFAVLDKPTASSGVTGLTTEGKVASFGGIVQSVENGHTQYADYPLRITMK
jgi:hypothetical protein